MSEPLHDPSSRPRAESPPTTRSASRVYLDAASVAPPRAAAIEAYRAALDDGWADPRRLHHEGRTARLLLDGARESIASGLRARTEEVMFTGSHVRAVHAAVLGTALANRRRGQATVSSSVEHSAVLHATEHVAGEAAVRIAVDRLGRVDAAAMASALESPGVVLACLQHANGEVGTLQPVTAVHAAARKAGVPLLVDAAASIGHVPALETWDLLTADPRGWGSVPGIGVLAVRAGTRWRSPDPAHDGTERLADDVSVPAALAAAVALEVALSDVAQVPADDPRYGQVETVRRAAAAVRDTEVVGDPVDRLPHVVTFSCLYVDGEQILERLDRAGFAVGSGSACTASTLEPSHVLVAMGVLTHGNVRVGLAPGTSTGDVQAFCAALPPAVAAVRALLGAKEL
jgi:cysteine desulfurase